MTLISRRTASGSAITSWPQTRAAFVGQAERPGPDVVVAPVAPYQRDQRIKEATQKRRDAEGRLRDARTREVELIKAAVERARREARGGRGGG